MRMIAVALIIMHFIGELLVFHLPLTMTLLNDDKCMTSALVFCVRFPSHKTFQTNTLFQANGRH